MDFLLQVLDFFRHLDTHLAEIVGRYGGWAYGILFAIIFCETGLVVTPILPGDSLLFAAGAIAATGAIDVRVLWVLLTVAAILGDTVNYWIGSAVGLRVFKEDAKVLKTAYLRRTQAFFAKHGGKTIILARFIPIVRTYAPFVAGASSMNYAKFLTYNVVGGVLWITLFLLGGFFFGNIPFVKENFELVVIVIVLLSVAPAVVELVKSRRAARRGGDLRPDSV
ncbi:MAG TPA: DedA family protein [Longimicrobiaceae bacterium]|nr:DedA family protein [Longimicrobiaceae bacterium]